MNKIKLAISQFPVTLNMKRNRKYILRHINLAWKKKADVIHFPELALSGYEITPTNIDWQCLEESLIMIKNQAKKRKINVVLGACNQSVSKKPYNKTIIISSTGKIVGEYSKIHLYKDENKNFQPGKKHLIHIIKGIKCGFLICYDSCFPKEFEYYRKKGVRLLFLSYYNANSSRGKNNMDELIRAQLITRAADNLMHIAASNSSAKYSRMPSSFAHPDGSISSLIRHKADVLMCEYPDNNLEWTYNNS